MTQSAFDPQLRSGTRGPYAEGDAGVRQSLDVMAKKIREGRFDPAVSGWARESLQNAGIDGRDNPSVKTQVSAILEALRARAIYTPDAVGAEVISSPSATLCLRKDLCLRGGDCDDLTVALGAALLSIGIPVAIVQQSYGNSRNGEPIQAHVLIAAQDENGGWMYADPSTRAPVGYASKAKSELWIDPLGEMPAAGVGAASAEIISIGRPRGKIVRRQATKPQPRIVGMGAAPHLMPSRVNKPKGAIGVGTFLGYPTIADLQALTTTMTQEYNDLQAAMNNCTSGFSDAGAWSDWQSSFQSMTDDYNNALTTSAAAVSTSMLPDFDFAGSAWGVVTGVIAEITTLDLQFRQEGSNCTAPTYSDVTQPSNVDPDLAAISASTTALNAVQQTLADAENAAKSALQPAAIAIGGLVIGGALAIGTVYLLGRFIPSR